MLQVALPNKGALAEGAAELVRSAGYQCRRTSRALTVRDAANDVTFRFLRPRDIAVYVNNGILDLGITGRDMLLDSDTALEELLALGFGKARFCYAAPAGSCITTRALDGLRIATSYIRLVAQDLSRRGVAAQLIPLDGAVEASIQLGVADVIADVVQTGRTLEEAGLTIIGEPVLDTEAILVCRKQPSDASDAVRLFIKRLHGIIVAREYVMVEYDCPESCLKAASAITPGIESPTIAPLSKPGWVAIKAMAHRRDINGILDALEHLGAKGILVTTIETCRI